MTLTSILAFVAGGFIARPTPPRDVRIAELEDEVKKLREERTKILDALVNARQQVIDMRNQLEAERRIANDLLTRQFAPPQTDLAVQQADLQMQAQNLQAHAPGLVRTIRNCAPSRGELLVPSFFRNRM